MRRRHLSEGLFFPHNIHLEHHNQWFECVTGGLKGDSGDLSEDVLVATMPSLGYLR